MPESFQGHDWLKEQSDTDLVDRLNGEHRGHTVGPGFYLDELGRREQFKVANQLRDAAEKLKDLAVANEQASRRINAAVIFLAILQVAFGALSCWQTYMSSQSAAAAVSAVATPAPTVTVTVTPVPAHLEAKPSPGTVSTAAPPPAFQKPKPTTNQAVERSDSAR